MTRGMDIFDFAGLLRRKAPIALASGLSVFIVAMVGSLVLPLRYESTTKVRVVDNRALKDIYGARLAGAEDATESVRAIHEEILSRGNLLALLEDLSPDAGLSAASPRERMVERERRLRELNDATRVDLVETTRGQFIFRISHRAPDAALAQQVVTKLSSSYQERLYRGLKDSASEALGIVRRKIGSLETEYGTAADELARFEETHSAHRFGRPDDTRARHAAEEENRNLAALELEALESQLADVRRRLAAESEWVEVEEEVSREPVVARIREEIRAAEEVLAALLEKWTEEHPDVQAQRKRIEQKREALASEEGRDSRRTRREPNVARVELAKAEWELLAGIRWKRRVLEDRETRLAGLSELLRSFTELKKEWEALVDRKLALRSQLGSLRDQEESAKITWQAKTAENTLIFEVLDPPVYPLNPASPNRPLVVIASVLLAFAAAVGLAFGLDVLDGTCRCVEEVAGASGLCVLGTVGRIEDRRERATARRGRFRRRTLIGLLVVAAGGASVAQLAFGAEIHELLSRIVG
jgi:polysaccharide chain length determinant protein (PEP-CTERM system associated)